MLDHALAPASNIESGWTDARVEQLKMLWGDGYSASQIAAQLGGGLSRNAVIGKASRMKLTGGNRPMPARPGARRPKPEPVSREPRSIAATKPQGKRGAAGTYRSQGGVTRKERVERMAAGSKAPVPVVPVLENAAAYDATALRLSITQINEHTCKWPIGDPQQPDFHFCGHESEEGKPYCEHHTRRASGGLPVTRRKEAA